MAKENNLLIVESPAKSKTIKKILGENYTIEASYGHVRNLPPKKLGFDIENDFKPTFEIMEDKKKVVDTLNKLAKKADKIYLASDPDREGEAIAWHVKEVLKVPEDKIYRVVFNEITPKAVKSAIENSREIDMNLVSAQQTRQILDKLVGFSVSPVLWKKMGNRRLSAGRVQSVALRLICEREDEIEKFVPVEFWTIGALLNKDDFDFEAELSRVKLQNGKDEKFEIKNKEEADEVLKILKSAKYNVSKITPKDTQRKPQAPFITSTLQREASNKLSYGVSKTMQVAQKLYEGIELGNSGAVGLITYMRTDSTRISDDAKAAAKDYIEKNYGEKYYPAVPNVYEKKSKNVQDAHEAIRPTYIEKTPESIKKYLTNEQFRLYSLIWSRFMASQMANAKIKNLTIDIEADKYILKAGFSNIEFDGFLKIYQNSEEEEDKREKFPDLKVSDSLNLKKIEGVQHFTQPPPRYSEASLVKALEEYGIGRPSTYAPIITKIQTKGYVEKIEKALKPTILGRTICIQLVEHFKEIMNYKFTASMELKLDDIAEAQAEPVKILNDFWSTFSKTVENAENNMGKVIIDSGIVCPNCGKPMVVRTSRFGKQFLGCSGFPECKTMMPYGGGEVQAQIEPEKSDEKCEKCKGEMVIKQGPYGKYLECVECKNRKKIVVSSGVKCPKCAKEGRDGELLVKKSRYGKTFYGCSKYPDCDFALWNEPTNEFCPECKSILVKKYLKSGNLIACSSKDCKYKRAAED